MADLVDPGTTLEDPFGTGSRRAAVLAAWAGSPTRFREDANAEEDLVVGGYVDRLVVELAQNAADAAVRAGVPGELRLALADGVLSAANTGAPLDLAGVDGLTSLRASPKRSSDSVGRFGVGFAAVLTVSDEPEVRSAHGGVAFSAARTRAAVAALGGPAAEEAARRAGRVPVLRLAWPVADPPPAGFDTEVRLPVRRGAEPAVRAALDAVDPTLLLGLPGLAVLRVGDRVIEREDRGAGGVSLVDRGAATRWAVVRDGGELPADLLADRPVEERRDWSVLAAVPVDADGAVLPLAGDQVVHAPTPSGEPLSLPLHLSASFPLDPSRRRVAPGPLTDWLTTRAAAAVAALAATVVATPAALALVPRAGLARAALDAALCGAVLGALREEPLLPPAGGPPANETANETAADRRPPEDEPPPDDPPRLRGRAAVALGPDLAPAAAALAPLCADVVPGLLPAGYATRAAYPALDALGAGRLDPAGLVDAVAGLDRPPAWWRTLYAALATLPVGADELSSALAALPVPLVDGRTVTGPRGALLPDDRLPGAAASALGLRVVHPEAAHPLLERLGARPATPRSVLADDRVRAAVATSLDAPDPEPLADAVLALAAAAGVEPGEEPWLAELALLDADGDWYPAGELLLPGSPLAAVVTEEAPFGEVATDLLAVHGPGVLTAVGCLTDFVVLDEQDVDLEDVGSLDLDRAAEWAETARAALGGGRGRVERLRAVRDLEFVRADGWPGVLSRLAAPPLRAVLAEPAVVHALDGRRVTVPSYTRWWLGAEPVLDGRYPGMLRTPDAADLAGLYDPADGDPAFLALLGCRTSLDDVLATALGDLLDRLADPERTVSPAVVPLVYARIAGALDGATVPPPETVRVAPDRVVDVSRVVVVDQPWRIAALGDAVPVLGGDDPEAVADLLDVPLLSELPD